MNKFFIDEYILFILIEMQYEKEEKEEEKRERETINYKTRHKRAVREKVIVVGSRNKNDSRPLYAFRKCRFENIKNQFY